jgi:hypothetical protein
MSIGSIAGANLPFGRGTGLGLSIIDVDYIVARATIRPGDRLIRYGSPSRLVSIAEGPLLGVTCENGLRLRGDPP